MRRRDYRSVMRTLKLEQRESHLSELLHTFYKQIIAAVRPKAPLLYAKLERGCKQDAPFQAFSDGRIAWEILVAMSTTDAMIPGEDATHDAALLALQLKPLPRALRLTSSRHV